ncbi:MAG: endolytic transglycosylase MltG [Desulfocapsaceae bacterium]|nr:endolytic transglycosylase MltG [Desulfocapsaceae bacterium]
MKLYEFISRRAARWAALLCVFSALAFAGWLMSYQELSGPESDSGSEVVLIPHGTSVAHIGHILAQARLIHEDIRFPLYAKLAGYSKKFRAGEFRLGTGQSAVLVMRELAAAPQIQYPVTIPEGLRAEEIARIFADGGWCDYDEFLRLIHDPDFIESLGIGPVKSLEGYLYPETYYLARLSTDSRSLIRNMVHHFQKVWTELSREGTGKLERQEVVILASMVEKETANPVERPLIASVFFNRMKLGMRLQSDPTVVYGIRNYSGTLTKEDLQRYTPYNTYLIPALPAAPICNPGRDSLRAVFHPAKEGYLYFVSRNDGTHQFSKNLAEHNQAVQKYQKDRNIQEEGRR